MPVLLRLKGDPAGSITPRPLEDKAAAGAIVVDGTGKTVLPELIDSISLALLQKSVRPYFL
jgi:hypothetical protein